MRKDLIMIGSPATRARHQRIRRPQIVWITVLLTCIVSGALILYFLVQNALQLDRVLGPVARHRTAISENLSSLQHHLQQTQVQLQQPPGTEANNLTVIEQRYAETKASFRNLLETTTIVTGSLALRPVSLGLLDDLSARFSDADSIIAALEQPLTPEQRRKHLADLNDQLIGIEQIISELFFEQELTETGVMIYAQGLMHNLRVLLVAAGGMLLMLSGILVFLLWQAFHARWQADERFQLVTTVVNSAIYDWDIERNRISWTDGLTDVFGYSLAEVKTTLEWWMQQIHPGDVVRVRSQIERSAALGQDFAAEYRFRAKNGHYRTVLDRGTVLRSGSRKMVRMVGSIMDITARKRAEAALAAEKERLAVTLSSIGEGVIATNNARHIVLINRVAEQLTGWSSEEAIGRPLREVFQLTTTESNTSNSSIDNFSSETFPNLARHSVLIARDGTKRIVADSGAPILDHEGRIIGVVLVFRDITERTMLEAQLQQTQKMESIGTLAGGIAHDFNNILTGIIGYVELAMASLELDEPLWEDLYQVKKQAEHAADLTRQLLAFSRRQTIQPRYVDLNKVIADTEKFLRRVIGQHIQLECIGAPTIATVYVDPTQVQQVLMNLCVNARDAMPNGGRLVIETRNITFDKAYCHTHLWASPGDYIELSVSDTGVGMDKETLKHVFEPFFTTKEPGKGTGLGLATVYGIVRQHSGLIHVYSEPGRGTRFNIYFRAVPTEEQLAEQATSEPPRGGWETILVTEDEEPVREVIVRTLEGLGYTVLVATNGEEAIETFNTYDDEIDLVLVDAVIPRLSGRTVYEMLHYHKPSLKFLLISSHSAAHDSLVPGPDLRFLHKPFNPTELARHVRELLDAL